MPKTIRFLSLLTTTLYASFLLAHLWEFPNKIRLSAADYLTVQQNYRGWAFSAILGVVAFILTLLTLMRARRQKANIWPIVVSLLCQIAAGVLFALFTAPANTQTNQWLELPTNWEQLRTQWEVSHSVSAILYILALSALFLDVINRPDNEIKKSLI
jgi:hypothetical protein